jgi:putative methionine-R-sulfoxide reductase with GAF domain
MADEGSNRDRRTGAESPEFPSRSEAKSLTQLAEDDLQATLQLLAERAQYITGASGSAIALLEQEAMICRARTGPSAPELGSQLDATSGLTGESIRTREIMRCDNAELDARVNRESCRLLGIVSVMAMPLVYEQEVVGVFELLSDRAHAFAERDMVALERLGEMIHTAVEHANAAKRIAGNIADPLASREKTGEATEAWTSPENTSLSPPAATGLFAQRACPICGFPISEARTFCQDCEAEEARALALASADLAVPAGAVAPAGLSRASQPSWLRGHIYLLAILSIAAATLVLLLWARYTIVAR